MFHPDGRSIRMFFCVLRKPRCGMVLATSRLLSLSTREIATKRKFTVWLRSNSLPTRISEIGRQVRAQAALSFYPLSICNKLTKFKIDERTDEIVTVSGTTWVFDRALTDEESVYSYVETL